MQVFLARYFVLVLAALLVSLGGCSNVPSRYYVLTALPSLESNKPVMNSGRGRVVEVAPLELPRYLDSLPILTRVGPNEFQLSDLDLWAEPLEESFPRVFVENIALLSPTDHVVLLPAIRRYEADVQVEVKVLQFDCTVNGDCVLNVRWSLSGKNGKRVLVSKNSKFKNRSKEQTHASRVEALNSTLTEFSKEVVSTIKKMR